MKLNKKIIAGIIVAIVIILALVGGFVYAKTDLFKSPKDLFYKYLLGDKFEFDYDEFLNEYKNSMEKSFTSNGELSVNLKSDDDDMEEISEAFSKAKYTFETKNNPNKKQMSSNIKLDYDNKNLIEASIVKNDEVYGIKSDILYDKYITVENNNLKDLVVKLGMNEDSVPNKIEETDFYELLYVSKEDRNEISKKYKEIINNSIPKEKYTAEKNVETKIDGETIKANAYKITLNERETLETIKSILETAKDDDKLKDLIVNKYNIATSNIPEDEKEELSKDNITDAIEEALEDIKDEIENIDDDDNNEITIKVFASKGEFIKLEISSNDNDKIEIQKYSKDDKNYIQLVSDDESLITVEYKVTGTDNDKKVEGTLTINSGYDEAKVEFTVSTKGKLGTGKNELEGNFVIKIEEYEVELKVKESVDYDAKVEIETLDNNNSSKLNDLSEDELEKLATDVSKNIQEKLPSKLEETGLKELFGTKRNTRNYNSYDYDF